MEDIIYQNSLYQVNEILKYTSPDLRARIPKKVIAYFEYNKSKNFNWKLDRVLPLEKQDLLPVTKEILTVLYKDYMCDDIEKEKIHNILKENEIKYQNELKQKYNPDIIFKNKEKNTDIEKLENKKEAIISYKESFLKKVINKIKLIFNK